MLLDNLISETNTGSLTLVSPLLLIISASYYLAISFPVGDDL